jgi:hypothetical protein
MIWTAEAMIDVDLVFLQNGATRASSWLGHARDEQMMPAMALRGPAELARAGAVGLAGLTEPMTSAH